MEQDRFDVLPAPIFAKGFLREYAKYVGLDPDEVVNFFLAAHPESDAAGEPEIPSSPVRQRSGLAPWVTFAALVLVVLVVLAVVGYLAFYAENRRSATRRPPPAASQPSASPAEPPGAPAATSEPAPPVPEESAAATPAPLAVTLDFTGECWIEVVVDGRQRIEELHVQGESLQIAAEESVLLATIGDPSSVEVQVNGLPFELVGPSGRPVHDVRIDLETVGGTGPGPA
jgi:cytoskeletal protein RodZ